MPKRVTIPMSDDEWRMLKALAKRSARTMAGWVRVAVGDAYESSPKVTQGHYPLKDGEQRCGDCGGAHPTGEC